MRKREWNKWFCSRIRHAEHTIDNWKQFEYWWNDPFKIFWIILSLLPSHCGCFFPLLQNNHFCCVDWAEPESEKACRAARNEARREDKSRGGFGVLCNSLTLIGVVEWWRGSLLSHPSAVCSLSLSSVFSFVQPVNSPRPETFLFIFVYTF